MKSEASMVISRPVRTVSFAPAELPTFDDALAERHGAVTPHDQARRARRSAQAQCPERRQ